MPIYGNLASSETHTVVVFTSLRRGLQNIRRIVVRRERYAGKVAAHSPPGLLPEPVAPFIEIAEQLLVPPGNAGGVGAALIQAP